MKNKTTMQIVRDYFYLGPYVLIDQVIFLLAVIILVMMGMFVGRGVFALYAVSLFLVVVLTSVDKKAIIVKKDIPLRPYFIIKFLVINIPTVICFVFWWIYPLVQEAAKQ